MAPKFDVYAHVTGTIIAEIEAGTPPWRKPWTGSASRIALPTRHDIASRAEGLRRLIQSANDVFVPDDDLADQMRGLSASLNRAGNNINQIAQRLNEAKRQGEIPPYGNSAHGQVRAFAGLIFDIADQVLGAACQSAPRKPPCCLKMRPAVWILMTLFWWSMRKCRFALNVSNITKIGSLS